MDKRFYVGALALVCCTPLYAVERIDAMPQFSTLDDAAMANLRGRYLNAGEVLHFGVQLATVWTRPDGSRVGGAVALAVEPGRGATLTRYNLAGATTQGVSTAAGATPVDVTGVAQVNQIAGAGNHANNRTVIDLVEGRPAAGLPAGDGWQQVSVVPTNTSGTLALTVNGGAAGLSTQSVGGGKLSQLTVIRGNGIQVDNAMRITVGLRPSASGQGTIAASIPALTQGLSR
ncbi:hypothetical protein JHS3_22130 [Jeongeupia sp. HS-3]|uniref:hypothetical protein n=1 Tax=Jeongeupia sp. HS-3 TaxID=1009682 RepID=UPI0018A3FDCD|nr:hypothetical protein [Jeongeupia sp. HS-3]BCL76477.1 hypothetical protein JHS3_22130 [Jeongeupia sp. HS-3]